MTILADQRWRKNAACLGQDAAWWDTPDAGQPNGAVLQAVVDRARNAIRICDHVCPVRAQCEADAAAVPPMGVIRAGTIYTDTGAADPGYLDRVTVRVATRGGAAYAAQLAVAAEVRRTGGGPKAIMAALGCSEHAARRLSESARHAKPEEVTAA